VTVVVVLQPAEETGKGAAAVLASGALAGVAAIFGGARGSPLRGWPGCRAAGPLAASADTFSVTLRGAGAHAARPHEGADPVVGAGALIGALQTVVARRVNPSVPAVLTVGSVHAGTAPNIIPDCATLSGTMRAVDSDTRALLQHEMRRVVEGVAAAHGLTAEVALEIGPPPLINASQPAGWARRAVEKVLGGEAIVPLGPLNLAAEDFASYLEQMPGCFLRIGRAREGWSDDSSALSKVLRSAREHLCRSGGLGGGGADRFCRVMTIIPRRCGLPRSLAFVALAIVGASPSRAQQPARIDTRGGRQHHSATTSRRNGSRESPWASCSTARSSSPAATGRRISRPGVR